MRIRWVEEKMGGGKGMADAEKIRMSAGDNNNEAGDGKDGRKEQLSRGEKNGAPALGRVGFPSSEKDRPAPGQAWANGRLARAP